MQTAGQVDDIEVSDDGTRVAAVTEPAKNGSLADRTLDVWSVSRSGTAHQLAALQVSPDMDRAEFIPHSHLVLFNPATTNEILPDILDPDASTTYHALCAATQRVLTPKTWTRYAPRGTPYEPPC